MFPPEIVDHILSFLQCDHATLKICAQVYPFISKLVERHLYTHLTIYNGVDDALNVYRPSELSKLIHDNPDIAKHARSLEIRLFLSALTRHSELDSILPMLTMLKSIVLDVPNRYSQWHYLSESFRTTFANCLRLPSLTNLEVSVVAFPFSLLDCSTSLRRLSLTWAFDSDYSTSSYAPPSLDTLAVPYSLSPEIIIQWTKNCSLRSLTFHGNWGITTGLAGLLEVCADSLTALKLQVPRNFHTRYDELGNIMSSYSIPISLSCLPHLKSLVIQFSVDWDGFGRLQWKYDTCLTGIMRMLDTLPSPPANLKLLLMGVYNPYLPPPIRFFDWSPLLSFPYFDVIPSIELYVCEVHGSKIGSTRLRNTLKQDHNLIQLERHRSFRLTMTENPSFQVIGVHMDPF